MSSRMRFAVVEGPTTPGLENVDAQGCLRGCDALSLKGPRSLEWKMWMHRDVCEDAIRCHWRAHTPWRGKCGCARMSSRKLLTVIEGPTSPGGENVDALGGLRECYSPSLKGPRPLRGEYGCAGKSSRMPFVALEGPTSPGGEDVDAQGCLRRCYSLSLKGPSALEAKIWMRRDVFEDAFRCH